MIAKRLHLPTAVVAGMLLIGAPVCAADHLEPEPSLFAGNDWSLDYDTMVAEAFKELYGRDIAARVVAEPSFQHEYGIGIRRNGARYSIVGLEPEIQLWGYPTLKMMESGEEGVIKNGKEVRDDEGIVRLRASIPADWHRVKINRCEAPIDAALAGRVVEVWRTMLRATRYAVSPEYVIDEHGNKINTVTIGSDGEIYHFSMLDDFNSLAGKTWSPDEHSRPAKLVDIVFTLHDMCGHPKPELTPRLSAQLDALERVLQTDASKDPKK
jgi:hypothetical protein